ncbi:S41 family peptidase [Tenacibaculum maritimum]|uniref:S41 family peptidase n=1 Tax=Tenacibaculum maritimum TaxID=107401 RepID=UPI001E2A177B|nr:S41 family peptidase [Tenacibaculum maritimum]MCD9585852.1 S41 family peptidase [Tenacibaculum maritimum]MCD9621986.1 S41 family peptidase [Tenacibaculum maritimum]MCD9628487.1 S41 family peptidase [Tenacibaculum maritimum]MCD9631473.1 S41 family peptidase [Tenacibaculum maritimum]MCD9634287.1 S41 family peptidase [Tenacibaculum maritimum]
MKTLKHILLWSALGILFTLQSCREEALHVSEIERSVINSYDHLFKTFWDIMNNDYNYFNEQEGNWDDIYREYSPKFQKLTTFNKRNTDPVLAKKEANLAFLYFAEIITGKILDQHFGIEVTIPLPSIQSINRQTSVTERFFTRMDYKYTKEDGFINLGRTYKNPLIPSNDINTVMSSVKLIPSTIVNQFPILSGFLKDDPETMYIRSNGFFVIDQSLNRASFPELKNISNLSGINESHFDLLKGIDPNITSEIKRLITSNLNDFKSLISTNMMSNEYQSYLTSLDKFINTELITDLQKNLIPLASHITTTKNTFELKEENLRSFLRDYLTRPNTTQNQKENVNKLYSLYLKKINDYKSLSGFTGSATSPFEDPMMDDFDNLLRTVSNKYLFDIYKKLYNPITKGVMKKIILDLRGNRGGAIADFRVFTERFITRQGDWGYQRTKEGNGRFNYSPWISISAKPHKFALTKDIPIVILIDELSLSMAEYSTMMIKSLKDNVTIIGDNSGGGTAGTFTTDTYNGGNLSKNNYITFYMPLMAFKNIEGEVIENIGITPDKKVIPTQEEVNQFPTIFIDPAFNAALKVSK